MLQPSQLSPLGFSGICVSLTDIMRSRDKLSQLWSTQIDYPEIHKQLNNGFKSLGIFILFIFIF